jgi:hypothetical protein
MSRPWSGYRRDQRALWQLWESQGLQENQAVSSRDAMARLIGTRADQLCTGTCLENRLRECRSWRGPRFANLRETCRKWDWPANLVASQSTAMPTSLSTTQETPTSIASLPVWERRCTVRFACLENIIQSTTSSNFIPAYMSHFDKLKKLPSGFVVTASTKNSEYAGIAHQTKAIYGTFSLVYLSYSSQCLFFRC